MGLLAGTFGLEAQATRMEKDLWLREGMIAQVLEKGAVSANDVRQWLTEYRGIRRDRRRATAVDLGKALLTGGIAGGLSYLATGQGDVSYGVGALASLFSVHFYNSARPVHKKIGALQDKIRGVVGYDSDDPQLRLPIDTPIPAGKVGTRYKGDPEVYELQ